MTDAAEHPVEEIEPHSEGKKLFQKGLIVFYILAILGILYSLFFFRSVFGIAGGVAIAACFIIAPSQLCKGSEGWKIFANLFGLFLAMAAVGGSFSVVGEANPHLRFFLAGCIFDGVFCRQGIRLQPEGCWIYGILEVFWHQTPNA